MTFEDCENTGAIYGNSGNVGGESGSVSADAKVGSVAGICGQSAGKVTLTGEIKSLGAVTSVIRENSDRVKVGSLIGIAANGVEVVDGAVVASNQLMMPLGQGSGAALNFASVDATTMLGTFQAAPTAAGNYAVTLPNSDAISFGMAEGEKLYIVTNICAYSGEVTTAPSRSLRRSPRRQRRASTSFP